ncbi:cytochrome bc complex cytochrome b subunit [Metallosphaera tengchongensis]|uniref:Cytochrome bc complex cytochrome b subunit n=1 Tax=Metallosphaera tengchongensis TaxID=1532350 RepID=A0A6N0NV72_9CREN|nr:proton pump complex cytochrome B SoxC [Metallosphaera tengchongensis]QKR00087.1 cytochrome bc complex cytochrome b subunit [Metallosphaera tengchongensis]
MTETSQEKKEGKKGLIDQILDRVGVTEAPFFKTPDYMYNVSYWLGAMVSGAFAYTVITGLFLLLYYMPANPYPQTQAIINTVPYGSVLLFSHLYGAYIMIILAYIHMFRNFYKGAYKKPRELQWVTGILLLALTMGASFFGYSLVSDVLGVNAINIGESLLVGTGFPGATTIANWLFGPGGDAATASNPLVKSQLFDRLLGWHIIMVFLIGLLFGVHFLMSERYGMTPSTKEKPKVPAFYTKEEWSKFNEWWPRNVVYMLSIVLMTWGIILFVPDLLANINGLPIVINPYPAPEPGTAAALSTQPYPPWFFLFLYKFVDFELPNGQAMSPAQALSILVVILLVLILMPFFENSEYMFLKNRKFWTWVMTVAWISLIELSVWGYLAPGVPAPTSQQIEILGIPAVLVGIVILAMGRDKSQKSEPSLNTPQTVPKIGPTSLLGTAVVSLLFAGNFGVWLMHPAMINFLTLFPLGGLMAYMVYRMASSFKRGPVKATGGLSWEEVKFRKTIALFALPVILVVTAIQTAIMWRLPSVGPQATYAGMDLGILLFLWGIAMQLYHYIVYVR